MNALEDALLAAHAAGDAHALVGIYRQAAAAAPDENTTAFLLTQAHVFALEAGHPDTGLLRAELIKAGRETALQPPSPPRR